MDAVFYFKEDCVGRRFNNAVVFVHQRAMTDAHSGFHEPETANDDRQDRLLKSLIAVCKENRDALSSLPEMMERFLDKKPVNPSLTETGLEEELCRYKMMCDTLTDRILSMLFKQKAGGAVA